MPRILHASLLALVFSVFVVSPPADAQSPGTSAIDREYRLVVGDIVEVSVSGHEELTREFAVPADGNISFPPLGKLRLLDRSVNELEEEIANRFKEKGVLTDPVVFVLIKAYSPRKAFLIGSVTAQISLPIHKKYNIVQVLSMAGASPITSDLRVVKIIRSRPNGESFEFTVNVEDVLMRSAYKKNVIVMPDDIIYVPAIANLLQTSYVYILGKVRSPGRYPFTIGREKMTLTKLIAIAGDFDQFARQGAIRILRKEGNRTRIIDIDFDEIIENEIQDVALEPDDLVYIPESPI